MTKPIGTPPPVSTSPASAERVTQRTLITVSHAIERAALAVTEDGPMVVFALFQRVPYLERERVTYRRIATSAAATVMGAVGPTPDPPDGVDVIDLIPTTRWRSSGRSSC